MQTSLHTTQQGSWYASGYHKAGARGKSVEHCFIGPAADPGLVSSFKAGGPRTFESTVLESR